MAAHRTLLEGGRWHFQHGPMDVVLGAEGETEAVHAAHERAWQRFMPLLDELVTELDALKRPVARGTCALRGVVARRMWAACAPLAREGEVFITPMAAVAGAVAQELIACFDAPGIARAWVNNGGDIALHLAPGASVRVGLYADIARLSAHEIAQGVTTDGHFAIDHTMPVRGVATSGWRGRSFSLGIADSVTVLAATAAQADAAATLIANAVNADDARIVRRPACDVRDGSDLGAIAVTVDVPALAAPVVWEALRWGLACAQALQARGLIHAAALVCQGRLLRTENVSAVQGTVSGLVGQGVRRAGDTEVGSVFA